MVHTYNGILFDLTKEGNPAMCSAMTEPGGYYAECNKPGTEA